MPELIFSFYDDDDVDDDDDDGDVNVTDTYFQIFNRFVLKITYRRDSCYLPFFHTVNHLNACCLTHIMNC